MTETQRALALPNSAVLNMAPGANLPAYVQAVSGIAILSVERGVLATIGLWVFTAWVAGPVDALFLLYDQPNPLLGPGATYPIAMVGLGATGGWLAALFAMQRYITRLNAH